MEPIINRVLISGTLYASPSLHFDCEDKPFTLLKMVQAPIKELWDKENFYLIAVLGPSAEECAQLPADSSVYIEGRLISHELEEAGKRISSMKILAESVVVLKLNSNSELPF